MTDFEDDLDLDEVSPEELEEAAALMAALEREHDETDVSDALGAASLLQYAYSSELDPPALDAMLADVLKNAKRPEAAPPWWHAWMSWAGAWRWVTAAGVVVVAVVLAGGPNENAAAPLPGPSIALLQAQASVAAGGEADVLDAAMSNYRSEILASLEARGR